MNEMFVGGLLVGIMVGTLISVCTMIASAAYYRRSRN